MLPKEILEFISKDWFEDNGGIVINKYEYNNRNLKIEIHLDSGDEDIQNQIWEIEITELKSEKLEIKWETEIEMFEEHFLLWEFIDDRTTIYFNGENENADNLLADIYRIHRAKFGNKFEIEKYLNVCMSLSELCNSKSGLFASGPKKILENYFLCLKKHNRKPNYENSNTTPEYKNNREKPLKLLKIGESHFVAENFAFKQK